MFPARQHPHKLSAIHPEQIPVAGKSFNQKINLVNVIGWNGKHPFFHNCERKQSEENTSKQLFLKLSRIAVVYTDEKRQRKSFLFLILFYSVLFRIGL